MKRHCLILGAVIALTFLAPPAPADTSTLLTRVRSAAGRLPRDSRGGYRLTGELTLRMAGEEIRHAAVIVRTPRGWAADFSHADPTRSMRFGSAPKCWAASPETGVDLPPGRVPLCASYDYVLLYDELLAILEAGAKNQSIRIATEGNEVYLSGNLSSGLAATFLLNSASAFLRKVTIELGDKPAPLWIHAIREPDGRSVLLPFPSRPSGRAELWFSDPMETAGLLVPRRSDYLSSGGMSASLVLADPGAWPAADIALMRPPGPSWEARLARDPAGSSRRPSLSLGDRDAADLRSRITRPPWKWWSRVNAVAALWGVAAPWLGALFPSAPAPATLSIGLGLVILGFIFVIGRRRRQFPGRPVGRLLLVGFLAWVLLLLCGTASMHVHSAHARSLLSLHLGIRYSVTGNGLYAGAAARLLRRLDTDAPARTCAELADECRASGLAYGLAGVAMTPSERQRIEALLYDRARPLYGALQGWRANSLEAGPIAAGLGIIGMVTGSEAYVEQARRVIDKMLETQVGAGLHRSGPGPGAAAMNETADFLRALSQAGVASYWNHPAFLRYLSTTVDSISPVGTLPLFGATTLDQSEDAACLLQKAADDAPEDLAGRCVSIGETFRQRGRYAAPGARKLITWAAQPFLFAWRNPTLLLHRRQMPASALADKSVVLGDSDQAVLRSGNGIDALYVVLNASGGRPGGPSPDALAFDLYAYGSLMLHGAAEPASPPAASYNTIVVDGEDQSGDPGTGITMSLLNQPLFDHVRAWADRAYPQAEVCRDLVLVRPQGALPGYVLLVDDIRTENPRALMRRYLHGGGDLDVGIDRLARWQVTPFGPPSLRPHNHDLTVWMLDPPGSLSTVTGSLRFRSRWLARRSEALVQEWQGPARFCTALLPRRAGQPQLSVERVGDSASARIAASDWISLGRPDTPRTTGSFTHTSEYAVVRETGSFPSLLLISGTEFRMGAHEVLSNKPVSISCDGLRGSILSTLPDTRVEFKSPDIEGGAMTVVLPAPGLHPLSRQ